MKSSSRLDWRRLKLSALAVFIFAALTPDLSMGALVMECQPLASLEETSDGCDENFQYAEAGQECLGDLEKLIQTRAGAAAAQHAVSNDTHTNKAGNNQANDFKGSGANYAISDDAFAELIQAAKGAQAHVDGYLNHIFYPIDFDAPEEFFEGVDPFEWVMGNECYGENRTKLEDMLDKIEEYIDQLEKAQAAVRARKGTSLNREDFQNSLAGILNPNAVGKIAGRSAEKKSDVTGVKKDALKRGRLPGTTGKKNGIAPFKPSAITSRDILESAKYVSRDFLTPGQTSSAKASSGAQESVAQKSGKNGEGSVGQVLFSEKRSGPWATADVTLDLDRAATKGTSKTDEKQSSDIIKQNSKTLAAGTGGIAAENEHSSSMSDNFGEMDTSSPAPILSGGQAPSGAPAVNELSSPAASSEASIFERVRARYRARQKDLQTPGHH